MQVILVATFVFRKSLIPVIVDYLYDHLSAQKKVKCSNYLLELVTTTIAFLVLFSWGQSWKVIFFPEEVEQTNMHNPDVSRDLASGLFISSSIMVSTYIIELAMDSNFRFELQIHHAVTIFTILWYVMAIAMVDSNMYVIRQMVILSLFCLTEQHVFLQLLLYQKGFYSVSWYSASVVFYAVTRAVIVCLAILSWYDTYDLVFRQGYNSFVVYGLFLFTPISIIILAVTQVMTSLSLIGLTKKVRNIKSNMNYEHGLAVVEVKGTVGTDIVVSEEGIDA